MAPWPERSRRQRWLAGLTACSVLFLVSVGLRAGEAPQQASLSSSTPSSERATLDRYCVSCHNSRTRTGGLALDPLDVTRVAVRRGDVGKGRPQASRPHDAAPRHAAAG